MQYVESIVASFQEQLFTSYSHEFRLILQCGNVLTVFVVCVAVQEEIHFDDRHVRTIPEDIDQAAIFLGFISNGSTFSRWLSIELRVFH